MSGHAPTNDPHDHHHQDEDCGKQRFYRRPVQRQKWGDLQVLPHTDWSATFFELFYVAAAYNLGNLIRFEPTSRGILYFVGLFAPVMMVWSTKMYYNARFCVRDNIVHSVYGFLMFVSLATAVLFIRPVAVLEDPNNYDLFAFSLSITFCHLLGVGRNVELLFFAEGEPAARTSAIRDLKWYSISIVLLVAATILSGVAFFGTNGGTTTNDAVIWLLLAGGVGYQLLLGVMVLCLPGGGKHKEIAVPMNIDFVVHQYGSFVMVMLGESVLSLLIVGDPESSAYYKTFFCGILSITLLEYLYFRSQPHRPDDHAMRRSKEAGILFNYLMFIYCGALLILGTTYKMMLYEVVYETQEASSSTSGHRSLLAGIFGRILAGGEEAPEIDPAERRQRVAGMFSGSMAVVWACSDLMIVAHQGPRHNFQKCKDRHLSLPMRVLAFLLFVTRIGMIAFIASLSQYFTEPQGLSFIGLCGIAFQVILRVAGTSLYGPAFDSNTGPEFESQDIWPNVTRPEVEDDAGKRKADETTQ